MSADARARRPRAAPIVTVIESPLALPELAGQPFGQQHGAGLDDETHDVRAARRSHLRHAQRPLAE